MKIKIKILKDSINTYYPILIKRYSATKMIKNAIESIFEKDMEDELVFHWYRSNRHFIYKIEKEISKLEDSDLLMDEIISFKDKMDTYYTKLKNKYGTFFLQVYRSITLIIEEGSFDDDFKEFYINIYSSVEIIEEEIRRIKSDE